MSGTSIPGFAVLSMNVSISPAKCQKIQGFLGQGWRVMASMGHIRALRATMQAISFEPQYEWIKSKEETIKKLKEAAKGATIYLAADKDREGECIAYSVCLLLRQNPKTTKRITFTEITEKAIREAVAHPGVIDMCMVKAQETRALLDRLIGYTISPLLWKYVAPSLSAGRCQTPALRLVIEREQSIQSFHSTTTWCINGLFNGISFQLTDELEDEVSALNYLENVNQTKEACIVEKKSSPWSSNPPSPLITSTLQQQASALYGMNPKQTMQVAQKLYETGQITYMRTDHACLSEEATKEAKEWVREQYGMEFVSQQAIKAKQEEQAQQAHEAIRPTHMDRMEGEGDVYAKKLYHLIWKRAIQSVMMPSRGETLTLTLQLTGDEFTWDHRWKRTLFEGWKVADEADANEANDADEANEWPTHLNRGDMLPWTSMHAEPKESTTKGRFTEATLVRELESEGIGRPSTFASLLSVIQEKNYVEIRDIPAKEIQANVYCAMPSIWPPTGTTVMKKKGAEKKKLLPTPLGQSVWNFLSQSFTDLFDYGFTAQMEKELDKIAEGTCSNVLQYTWESYKEKYETLQSMKGTERSNVKEFSNGLKAVQSKKGPILLIEETPTRFLGWPAGVSFEEMTEEKAIAFEQSLLSFPSWDGVPVEKKSGTFGTYFQCGTLCIPFQEESWEETIQRLEAKKQAKESEIVFKEYVIRTGQYGPYIMKKSLKKPIFVSIPKGIPIEHLTEKEVEALYKLGKAPKAPKAKAQKAKAPKNKNNPPE